MKSRTGAPSAAYWTRLANFGALYALFFVIAASVLAVWVRFGQDYVCYYAWAKLVLAGRNPYDYDLIVAAMSNTIGRGGNCPIYYPLWFTYPFIPLASIDFQVSRLLWLMLLPAFWLMALKLTDRGWSEAYPASWVRWLVWLAAFFLFGWASLRPEQIAFVFFFDWAVCIWAVKRGHVTTAAVTMALLLLKPNITFLVFLVLFVYASWRYRRFALEVFTVLVLFLSISTVVTPGWWEPIVEGRLPNGLNQGLTGYEIDAKRLTSTTADFLDYQLGIVQAPAILIQAGIGISALYLVWRWRSHILFDSILALTVVFLATPYAMQYDYALLTPAFLWVVHHIPRLNVPKRVLVLAGVAFLASILFWERPVTDGLWMPITLTALLLVTAPMLPRGLSINSSAAART